MRERFAEEVEYMRQRGERATDRKEANQEWERLKGALLTSAEKVCGWSKGGNRKAMRWSEEVEAAWKEKWRWEMVYNMTGTEKAKEEYRKALRNARKMAKREFSRKISDETKELESREGRNKVFKLAKKLKEAQDITGTQCLRQQGRLVISEEEKMKVWGEYFEKLLNEENPWDRDTTKDVDEDRDTQEVHRISEEEVEKALKRMKEGKAAETSGVVAEMPRAAGRVGVEWLT